MNKYSAKDCLNAFCARMNQKAKELGMSKSRFTDPAGITNLSCAYDIMQALQAAYTNNTIKNILTAEEYTAHIKGAQAREYTFESKAKVGKGHQCLRDYYELIAAKGGTLTRPHIFNLASIVRVPDSDAELACVIMKAADSGEGPLNRFEATKQAIDAAVAVMDGKTPGEICAQSAIVCTIDNASGETKTLIDKNTNDEIMPASTTKLLTALVALDYIDDLSTLLPVTQDMIDLFPAGYYTKDFFHGDTVSALDLLHAMMLPSSNTACFITACYVGAMLLENQAE